MKNIIHLISLAIIVLLSGCADQDFLSKQNRDSDERTVTVHAAMPSDNSSTRISLETSEGSLTLSPKWDKDDIIKLIFVQDDIKVEGESATIYNISEDGKKCSFNLTLPEKIDIDQPFTLYTFVDIPGFGVIIESDEILVDISPIRITPIKDMSVPVWSKTAINSFVNDEINLDYLNLGAYEVIQIKNSTDSDLNFYSLQLVPHNESSPLWYYDTTASSKPAFNPETGMIIDYQRSSSQGSRVRVASGETETVLSWYVPNNENIPDISLKMEEVLSYEFKEGKDFGMQAGRAYYIYAVWDGNELFMTDDDYVVPERLPEVTTVGVSSITTATFAYEGNVINDGGAEITSKGICWSLHNNPTIDDNKTDDGAGAGLFNGTAENLTPEKTYFVRAYATNSVGTAYGEELEVTLLKQETLVGAEQAYPGVQGETVEVEMNGKTITCDKKDGKLFYQGDIIILPNQLRAVALDYEAMRWPNNVVYYKIDPSFPQKERIAAAFELFSQTDIRFKERTNEANYVLFKYIEGAGSYSYLGMIGGEQEIVIDTWAEAGTVAHEIGHALGLLHEQSKPDRDDYIKVIYENIIEGYEHNFDIWPYASQYIEGFDFNSLMCYHSWGFTTDWSKPTMTKLDGTTFDPQREYFTEIDLELINQLYPAIADLQLEMTEVTLTEGDTQQLNIISGSGSYSITQQNNNIATAVLAESVITIQAVSSGETDIIVTDNITDQNVTLTVIVEEKEPSEAYLSLREDIDFWMLMLHEANARFENIKDSSESTEQKLAEINELLNFLLEIHFNIYTTVDKIVENSDNLSSGEKEELEDSMDILFAHYVQIEHFVTEYQSDLEELLSSGEGGLKEIEGEIL